MLCVINALLVVVLHVVGYCSCGASHLDNYRNSSVWTLSGCMFSLAQTGETSSSWISLASSFFTCALLWSWRWLPSKQLWPTTSTSSILTFWTAISFHCAHDTTHPAGDQPAPVSPRLKQAKPMSAIHVRDVWHTRQDKPSRTTLKSKLLCGNSWRATKQ